MAAVGEEMIIVVIEPSFRVMMGPWSFASLASDLCGLLSRLRRLPRIGMGFGPGGSLAWFVLVAWRSEE